jgi:hypothetical protein
VFPHLYYNPASCCFFGKELFTEERKALQISIFTFVFFAFFAVKLLWLQRQPRQVHLCPSVVKVFSLCG